MNVQTLDPAKVRILAEMLEIERRGHCHRRTLCVGMFALFFLSLIVSVGIAVFVIMDSAGEVGDKALPLFSLLGALSAAVMSLFGILFTVQNCINSIERTLFAARVGDLQLFQAFLDNLECASKGKRGQMLALAKTVLLG